MPSLDHLRFDPVSQRQCVQAATEEGTGREDMSGKTDLRKSALPDVKEGALSPAAKTGAGP